MNEEEFIKQRCEIDNITEEEFEEQYRVVKCNCGQPYCKGYRCLDLDDLLEENQKLEKQLEDISEELELVRCDLHNRTSERNGYERELNECLFQQKVFIKYLAKRYNDTTSVIGSYTDMLYAKKYLINEILQKYKEIIGVSDENNKQ